MKADNAGGIRKNKTMKQKQELECYAMISLHILGFIALTLYPIAWAARLAWYYYDGTLSNMRFVGWQNFVSLFTVDSAYWKTWITTFQFALCKLPIELPLAMLLALLLNARLKGRGFFRAMFYLPNMIGVAIIGLIFTSLFDYFGLVNAWLMKLGIIAEGIDWFSQKWTAMAILVLGSVWNTVGMNILYFLAALQNVPQELYESAYLEGATRPQAFFKITLPLMGPVLQVVQQGGRGLEVFLQIP